MELAGLVKRIPDTEDRRVTRVQLTPSGRNAAGKLIPQHSSDVEKLFSVLNEREKTQLRMLLDKLIQSLEPKHESA
jgi:DNA-binding MarR family transcriptional regulator